MGKQEGKADKEGQWRRKTDKDKRTKEEIWKYFSFITFHGSKLPAAMPEYETSLLCQSCLLLNISTWCMKVQVPPKAPLALFL